MTALDERPTVSLDKPGREVVARPDDELEVRPPAVVVPWRERATRARQACARATVVVADQPAVARTVAVGKQVPRATWRLSVCAPRGATRTGRALGRWLRDADSAALLARHAEAGEGESYAKVAAARQATNLAGRRALAAGIAGVVALTAMAWWWPHVFAGLLAVAVFAGVLAAARGACREPKELAMVAAVAAGLAWVVWRFGPDLAALVPQPPGWAWITFGGCTVLLFGWLGRHEDRPLIEKPARMVPNRVPELTAPMTIAALIALGNSKMADADVIRILMDPHRNGPGVQIDLELPPAVTATWVMDKREELAAALRREIGTVWPARGPRHPGHLSLFVTDLPMSKAIQEPWPLRGAPVIDLFESFPAFTDQRGQWVNIQLAYASVVIGAVPRMGKTFTVREFLLAAGMDVRAKIGALDGKGTGDFASLRPYLHFYSVGDDEEEYDRILKFFRGLRQEMRRRARVIRDLPHERCPDSKVTSELANDRSLGLEPWVVGLDETQIYFEDAPKEIRDELTTIVVDLAKRGPALAIMLILATQTVTKDTIPTGIANNAVIRLCLKMEGHQQNDRVLGTGMYKRGIDAQMFDIDDKGIAYLKAEGSEPKIVRSVFGLDAVESARLAELIRANRMRAGRLTGDAVDEMPEIPRVDIVADVAHLLTERRRQTAQHVELVEWLRGLRPDDYEDLDVDELSVRLRNRGVQIGQVKRNGRNAQGVDLRKQDPEADPFRSYPKAD